MCNVINEKIIWLQTRDVTRNVSKLCNENDDGSDWGDRIDEDFDNINRTMPVKIAGELKHTKDNNKKSTGSKGSGINTGYISIPTKAEQEYFVDGIKLPNTIPNLKKLLDDFTKNGKFDYELCYIMRKQEAQEKLKDLMKDVITKRSEGDMDFMKNAPVSEFSELYESKNKQSETSKIQKVNNMDSKGGCLNTGRFMKKFEDAFMKCLEDNPVIIKEKSPKSFKKSGINVIKSLKKECSL
jgi:hypothetical protein